MSTGGATHDNRRAFVAAAAVTTVLIPAWWLVGLDQAIWLIVPMLWLATLGARALLSVRILGVFGLAFLLIASLSGALTAEGTRFLTLAREVVIIAAFVASAWAVAAICRRRAVPPLLILGPLVFVVAISSALSIVAFVFRVELSFSTLVGPLVPDAVASTRLGSISLVERSLGTHSFFLGQFFLRPHGFFLFSTSQAVAQAVLIPAMLAGRVWYGRYDPWWTVAAGVSAAALLLTTTRSAIVALAVGVFLVWLARRWTIGHISIEIPLNARSLPVIAAVVVAVAVFAHTSGLTAPVVGVVTTRSLDFRTQLYSATIDRWAERPVLGWGTEVDWLPEPRPTPYPTPTPEPTRQASPTASPTPTPVPIELRDPSASPPLGSHSHYLGILFKQGMLGLVLFAALVGVLLDAVRRLFAARSSARDWIIAGSLASLIAAVTESLWLDPATAVIVGTVWGFCVGLGDAGDAQPEAEA